jgi:leucyl/phenylalanyl-tRNA--protein transferase
VRIVPIAPAPTPWAFPPHSTWDPDDDLVALGADLEPGTLVTAYGLGLFPMPVTLDAEEHLGWFSPVDRGVLPLDGLRVSRSLRRSVRDFEIRIDSAFDEVMAACGSPDRPDGWITPQFRQAYGRLHRLGWAHSVEAWRDGRLAGGLYGVAVGGLFAGESMFHRERDPRRPAPRPARRPSRARRAVADPAPGLARSRTPHARGVPRVPPALPGRPPSRRLPAGRLRTATGGWARAGRDDASDQRGSR